MAPKKVRPPKEKDRERPISPKEKSKMKKDRERKTSERKNQR